MAHVAASWALAQTVDGALKLSREAVIAASDDNVQVVALLACERFGATVAISTLTRTKIEAMIRQQAKTAVQKFLLAKIGYSKGGSIDALSKSAEGIRFLSLASALISTNNNFDAATALEKMVKDTAEEKDLSPTVYQLKDLLDKLEPRLNKARFLDEVVGFQSLFYHVTNEALTANIVVPSPEAIYELVKSFRELSRLGDEETRSLKITVGPFAPWVSAFARWSIEVPPRIYYETEDAPIIDQPDSHVTICVSKDSKYGENIEIETIHAYHSIHKVVNAIVDNEGHSGLATGMVSFETHASLTLKELRLNDDLGLRTCKQVLPYALHFIRSKFAKFEYYENKVSTLRSLNPFPDEDVVATVMDRYLGEDRKSSLKRLEQGRKFGDLPLVHLWMNQHIPLLERQPARKFYRRLSFVVADILALSLIATQEHRTTQANDILLLYIPNRMLSSLFERDFGWAKYIQDVFEAHDLQGVWPLERVCAIEHIMTWALKLVGHDIDNDIRSLDWVASSFRGQVLLPRILIASEILSTGYACLSYFPGTLMLETQKGRPFSRVLSKYPSSSVTTLDITTGISSQLNAFPKAALKWEMSSKAEHLELSMGWTFNRDSQRPLNIIKALTRSIILSCCSHPMDVQLSTQGRPALLPPGTNRPDEEIDKEASQLAIYPLYGSEELKLLALASTGETDLLDYLPVLINRGACIDCVIKTCFNFNCSYAIL